MELMNEIYQARPQLAGTPAWTEAKDIYVRMLAPVAPHLADELWHELGHEDSIHVQAWPEVDEDAAKNEEITLVVQVNGKVRDRVSVPFGLGDDQLKEAALATEGAQRFTEGLTVRKVIVVPGRLVNIVAG
jgi:leucyl-tRNA synthetase